MDISAQFAALDTALSLHYLTNTTDPAVHELCASATNLAKKRIDKHAVESILGVDSKIWAITYVGARDVYCIGPPAGTTAKALSGVLEQRKAQFEAKAEASPQAKEMPLKELATVPQSTTRDVRSHLPVSRDKVNKVRTELANTTRRFTLKEAPTGGLSLLERIKLKEKARTNAPTPESGHAAYIQSKVCAVYEILYEMTRSDEKSYSFPKVVSIIKDSTMHSISDKAVSDVLASISSSLPTKVSILHVGEIKALKIRDLDRENDLAHLKSELHTPN